MKNKYERQVPIDYWLIQLEDIERIYNFINSRLAQNNITIDKELVVKTSIKLQSGDTITYESFDEIKGDAERLRDLLSQGETVKALDIGSSVNDCAQQKYMHIWLAVSFDETFSSHHINIYAEDSDGSLRDCVLGSVESAQKVFALLTVKDKILITLKTRFPQAEKRIIVFDIFGNTKTSILEELGAAEQIVADQEKIIERLTKSERFSKFLRENWIPALLTLVFTIVGGIAGIISLFK